MLKQFDWILLISFCSLGIGITCALVLIAFAIADANKRSEERPPIMHDPACPQVPDDVSWLADAKNCNKYYQCVSGNKYEFRCPGELEWNPKLEVCDFKWNAGCEASN